MSAPRCDCDCSKTVTSVIAQPDVEKMASHMTLRDYFAARALQGFCAGQNPTVREVEQQAPLLAKGCYQLADAMLKARHA